MLLPLNDSDDALLPNGLSVVSFVALQGGWGPQVTKAKLWEGGGSFCDVGFLSSSKESNQLSKNLERSKQ